MKYDLETLTLKGQPTQLFSETSRRRASKTRAATCGKTAKVSARMPHVSDDESDPQKEKYRASFGKGSFGQALGAKERMSNQITFCSELASLRELQSTSGEELFALEEIDHAQRIAPRQLPPAGIIYRLADEEAEIADGKDRHA